MTMVLDRDTPAALKKFCVNVDVTWSGCGVVVCYSVCGGCGEVTEVKHTNELAHHQLQCHPQ
jgi:hypothetical protein